MVANDPRHTKWSNLSEIRWVKCILYWWKQCVFSVITTMTLRQFIPLGTWRTVTHCWYQWTKMLNKGGNISGHKWSMSNKRHEISKWWDGNNIYLIMKTWSPPSYHLNGFMHLGAEYTVTHCWYQWTKELGKLSKERNLSDQKWSISHKVLKSHRSNIGTIYVIIKKERPLSYESMALWQLMYFGTWCTVTYCWYHKSKSTPQAKQGSY